ncbi:MAG: glycerol-3-phosphate dehydrogenase/oxidase [Cytophagales bacterium]|nr:glycerol-3-phosphate dehydrogenase/oxidase [Cytophagales bacterium]
MTHSTSHVPLSREQSLARLQAHKRFDVIVIGGGSTGLGVALDAAARGLSVALFESHDFASGTSSRSTKLVHGGVRYLAQGHIPLVREALRERSRLLANAPHNAHSLQFVMPSFRWWEKPFYGVGLKVYDALAGSHGLGATEFLSRQETERALPGVRSQGLSGGVRYFDGQFNDARLAIDLARTAASLGAIVLNYCRVAELIEDAGQVVGVRVVDVETQQSYAVQSGCVINAAGVWADALRGVSQPSAHQAPPAKLVEPSRGVHLVVSRDFMPTDTAMMIPKTRDGRVLFLVPWQGHLILGTTDTPVTSAPREPEADQAEVDFILSEAAHYLKRPPTRADVLSIWAGLRPLVQSAAAAGSTKSISREHTIEVAANGLLTVVGGKWTTYRAMSEDVLLHAIAAKLLPAGTCAASVTADLPILGADSPCNTADLTAVLDPSYVQFAVEYEFARTIEDVLARRSRVLFLDAKRAEKLAPAVENELIKKGLMTSDLPSFVRLTQQYQMCP